MSREDKGRDAGTRRFDEKINHPVWQLVYAEDFAPPGSQFTNCGAPFAEVKDACDYCGKPVREIIDLIEQADKSVLEADRKVEKVHGTAASRLQAVGGIGAFLRF